MERPLHFIEHIIEEDLAQGLSKRPAAFPFSPRTQRLFTYRSCKSHMLKF